MDGRDSAAAAIALAVVALTLGEIALLIATGNLIGISTTLAALVVASIIGFFTLRRLGLDAVRRVLEAIEQRRLSKSVGPQAASFAAGILLIFPGFASDALAFALLLFSLVWYVRRARQHRHSWLV